MYQIKPKLFVGSDATVWASHLIENRHHEVVLHEECNSVSRYSIEMQNFCARLSDVLRCFCLQTIKEDVMLIDEFESDERYRNYEKKKTLFLKRNCLEMSDSIRAEIGNIHTSEISLLDAFAEVIEAADEVLLRISSGESAADIWSSEEQLSTLCSVIVDDLDRLNLPRLKRKVIDLCDAGPGVGLTNHAVLYRVCAEIIICRYDYYIRLHLAPGDSSNNEVERIQSSIGDAICDGGTLQCDYYKKYADLTEEEITEMTVEDHEQYKWERMERNAFAVCEEVNSRVDGAATVDGYMKSYVSKHVDDLFFWDGEFLKSYIDGNKSDRKILLETPGTHFYNFPVKFW